MSDFFKFGGSPPAQTASPADTDTWKEGFKQSIRSELALANAQQLINATNDKCYLRCVTKPSSSLSSSEEACVSRCLDRYLEAFNIVSRAYSARLVRERNENPTNTL